MKRFYVLLAVIALIAFMPAGRAEADSDKTQLQAVPFTFVGSAADCAPSPAGSRIVTAAWLGGMGLPDNGGPNATTPNDPHTGLLLSKNGPTADCSSAGARITGVKGMTVDAAFTIGFEYRNGGHCGAGAPRFNVVAKLGSAATAGEGQQNLLCAGLAGAVLVGLAANAAWGLWWLDPAVGLLIAAAAVREGLTTWRGDTCACCA